MWEYEKTMKKSSIEACPPNYFVWLIENTVIYNNFCEKFPKIF